MNVNGITSAVQSYDAYQKQEVKDTKVQASEAVSPKQEEAATFEKATGKQIKNNLYTQDTNLIAKLKADSENRVSQFQTLVNKMLNKQGKTFDIANGTNLQDLFTNLAVDAATKKQAQEDISENGYWGVKQTSERMFDFAKALSGGDPEKMEKMRSAFEKGYAKAEKQWGGKLPEISKQTYDATQKLFDDYKQCY